MAALIDLPASFSTSVDGLKSERSDDGFDSSASTTSDFDLDDVHNVFVVPLGVVTSAKETSDSHISKVSPWCSLARSRCCRCVADVLHMHCARIPAAHQSSHWDA